LATGNDIGKGNFADMAMDTASVNALENPICSVCIANYNGVEIIGDAIESVYTQDCDFAVEIIIHDDASTDGSVNYLQEKFPEVKLITSDRNVGFCISNNRMVTQAKGEYILLLNNDAKLFPNALSALYAHTIVKKDKTGILGLPQYDAITGNLIDFGILLDPFLNTIPNLNSKRSKVGMIMGACLWSPKWLWDELGGFLEHFHSLAEDVYLGCLARLCGYEVEIIQSSGFWHRVGYSFGGGKILKNKLSTSKSRRSLSERNKSYVMILTYPCLLFYAVYPLHILLLLCEGIAISVIKKDPNLWRSIYGHCFRSQWRNRHMLYRMRKRIQRRRRISIRRFLTPFVWTHQKLRMVLKHGLPGID
jgi:GT2 family glycosyltransferase